MASIRKIETTKIGLPKKLKVAAYARVSTDSDEQLLSLKPRRSITQATSKAILTGSSQGFILMKVSPVPR